MRPLADIIATLEYRGECSVEPCGSRVTCNPPPTNTDQDFLVVARPDVVPNLVNLLSEDGFRWEGSIHYQTAADDGFMSWRRDDINFIVTANEDFARRHRAATALCTRLNLQNKQDRIALFQAVLYGNQWDGVGDAPKDPAADLKVVEEEIAF